MTWKTLKRSVGFPKSKIGALVELGVIRNHGICICKVLSLMLFTCRLFGICPLTWSHPKGKKFHAEDGGCVFQVSKFWIIYSIAVCVLFNIVFYRSFEYDCSSFIQVLDAICEIICYSFATLLIFFGILNSKKLAISLNGTGSFMRRGLLCESSKQSLLHSSRKFFILLLIEILIQIAAMMFIAWNDHFSENMDFQDILSSFVHNIPFMFYYKFCIVCALFVGLFACFETGMHEVLFKKENHKIDRDQLTSLIAKCEGEHGDIFIGKLNTGTVFEEIDFLRRLHEYIRLEMKRTNAAFNPQIPILVSVEIVVLVMYLYSIITFFYSDNKTPDAYTIHFLDVMFVVLHIVGLVIFILSTQGSKRTQIGLMKQISDYSSRHLSPEEFAQIRLFSIKLTCAPVQVMAWRFYPMDITLLATISGYVVTYLLVALQMKTPGADRIQASSK